MEKKSRYNVKWHLLYFWLQCFFIDINIQLYYSGVEPIRELKPKPSKRKTRIRVYTSSSTTTKLCPIMCSQLYGSNYAISFDHKP